MNTVLIAGTPLEAEHHNVTGNGERDGSKSSCIGQSAAKRRIGEGSTTSGLPHRDQVISKSTASSSDEDIVWACEKSQEKVERKCVVYGLKAVGDDHCRYIGQTEVSLSKRLAGHLNHARNSDSQSHVHRWVRSIERKGGSISIQLIESDCAIDENEIKWIKHYRSLYTDMVNIANGGSGGVLGLKRSEEVKAKMRKPKSDETKLKMRKPKSAATKAKMSLAQLGNTKGVGEKNGNAKLTTEKAVEIMKMISKGLSLNKIAEIFGVSKSTIWKVKDGRAWRHATTNFRNKPADTITEAVSVPLEIRGKIPDDYGRSKGIAWYSLGNFGITHADSTSAETKKQCRIIKWDSAA